MEIYKTNCTDRVGRVVIPAGIRKMMNIKNHDPLEFYIDGEKIILRKADATCIFCGDEYAPIVFEGKRMCLKCQKELKSKAKGQNSLTAAG